MVLAWLELGPQQTICFASEENKGTPKTPNKNNQELLLDKLGASMDSPGGGYGFQEVGSESPPASSKTIRNVG